MYDIQKLTPSIGILGRYCILFNLYLTNGFSHRYQLDEPTFIFRGVRSDFYFSFVSFLMKFLCANKKAPDGTPRSAGVTSGAILFAYVPQKGRQAYMS